MEDWLTPILLYRTIDIYLNNVWNFEVGLKEKINEGSHDWWACIAIESYMCYVCDCLAQRVRDMERV